MGLIQAVNKPEGQTMLLPPAITPGVTLFDIKTN